MVVDIINPRYRYLALNGTENNFAFICLYVLLFGGYWYLLRIVYKHIYLVRFIIPNPFCYTSTYTHTHTHTQRNVETFLSVFETAACISGANGKCLRAIVARQSLIHENGTMSSLSALSLFSYTKKMIILTLQDPVRQ